MTDLPLLLVIDDEPDRLEQLAASLRTVLHEVAEIVEWQPKANEDPLARFEEETSKNVRLVATDQDLTRSGTGLLGSSIASWAQDKYLPVCNFSRQPQRRLPRERNFFEIRVPSEATDDARAHYIARIFRGFETLRSHVESTNAGAPLAQLLAGAMGLPALVDDVTPFVASVGLANAGLIQGRQSVEGLPTGVERIDLVSFILGHTLLNAVLEFPGPILGPAALAAYCATGPGDADRLAEVFKGAEYVGPFAEPGAYFVKGMVDRTIDELASSIETDATDDQYNKAAVASVLDQLHPHACSRCGGERGGFWCPFVQRAVCNRTDCSVQANAWIPRGASLCRVEKDYFDEWSPLLGG